MKRTSRLLAACLAVASIALQPASAWAAQEDVQGWVFIDLKAKVDNRTTATFDINPRFRSESAGGDMLGLSVTLDHEVSNVLTVGGGLAMYESSGPREWRAFQFATVGNSELSLRSRIEERMFDGAPRTELRLRERLQFKPHLTPKIRGIFRSSGSISCARVIRSAMAGRTSGDSSWVRSGT